MQLPVISQPEPLSYQVLGGGGGGVGGAGVGGPE